MGYLLLLEGESPDLGERQKMPGKLSGVHLAAEPRCNGLSYLDGLFYSGTNVSRLMFDKSVMYAKSP